MTVKDLIKELKKHNPDLHIFVASELLQPVETVLTTNAYKQGDNLTLAIPEDNAEANKVEVVLI